MKEVTLTKIAIGVFLGNMMTLVLLWGVYTVKTEGKPAPPVFLQPK